MEALHQRLVGANRTFQVPLLFRHLPLVEKLLRVTAHLFLARRHILGVLTRLEHNRAAG